jgi:hypothetical protein
MPLIYGFTITNFYGFTITHFYGLKTPPFTNGDKDGNLHKSNFTESRKTNHNSNCHLSADYIMLHEQFRTIHTVCLDLEFFMLELTSTVNLQ